MLILHYSLLRTTSQGTISEQIAVSRSKGMLEISFPSQGSYIFFAPQGRVDVQDQGQIVGMQATIDKIDNFNYQEELPLIPSNLMPYPVLKQDGENWKWPIVGGGNAAPAAWQNAEPSFTNGLPSEVTTGVVREKFTYSGWQIKDGYWFPTKITMKNPPESGFNVIQTWTLSSFKVTPGTVDFLPLFKKGASVIDYRSAPSFLSTFAYLPGADFWQMAALSQKMPSSHFNPPAMSISLPSLSAEDILVILCLGSGLAAGIIQLRKGRQVKKSRKSGAFTLVELLVVISIISLLAALLFPVLSKAKVAAYERVAASNLHQVQLGQFEYMNDWDDRYPVNWIPHLHVKYFWPQNVAPYIEKPKPPRGPEGEVLMDDLPKVFFDPIKPFHSQLLEKVRYDRMSSWGLSWDLTREFTLFGRPSHLAPVTSTEVYDPAGCLNLVETDDHDYQASPVGFPGDCEIVGYEYSPFLDWRVEPGVVTADDLDAHFPSGVPRMTMRQPLDRTQRALCAFCDGHIKAVPAPKIVDNNDLWAVTADKTKP